ncbi:MAG: preprotein translocase subunit SecY [Patescibacteria group bacterium]|nr:preprotein translocase subunit SecY [Patescibacteria group bacterium]
MFQKIAQIFKIKELRKKILFAVGLLIVFRFTAHIPVPGIDAAALKSFFESNQIFGLLNMFTGGGMENFSIVAMGVGPYITSSIIMQLLVMVVPALEKMQKEEGEDGRRKMNQITRWLTIPLAALQSYSMIVLLQKSGQNILGDLDPFKLTTMIITLTAGTIFLMWLGELITEKGIGNGVSLIIFAGIVSAIPMAIQQTFVNFEQSKVIELVIFAVVAVVVIAGIVFITEGQRNIPVQYARRVRGMKMYGGTTSHLPLKVNQAGVIPIIFAMSLMLLPGMIANFLVNVNNAMVKDIAQNVADLFNNNLFYGALYFVMVIFFTYFYTAVTFDPKQISEHLQKQGGFIPGIRPGTHTREYLTKTMTRITLTGSFFLGLVAVLPFIMKAAFDMPSLVIGGTGILIVVSVVIETVRQIESEMVMRDYESFY